VCIVRFVLRSLQSILSVPNKRDVGQETHRRARGTPRSEANESRVSLAYRETSSKKRVAAHARILKNKV